MTKTALKFKTAFQTNLFFFPNDIRQSLDIRGYFVKKISFVVETVEHRFWVHRECVVKNVDTCVSSVILSTKPRRVAVIIFALPLPVF